MNQLDRYIIFGLRQVEGWLDPYSADVITALSEIQRRSKFVGAVGEIGVHHGKLFILLALTSTEDEKSFAVDVFENQKLNVDRSGRGDRDKFLSNFEVWAGAPSDVIIISRSSLDVRPKDILSTCGHARLVSIDGGHTEECAMNDLRLIESVLTETGIVVLDDYFNQEWPDVSTGASKYLSDPTTKLRPFAISPGKVYLTAPSNADFYRSQLRQQERFKVDKFTKMFGHEVDIYGCSPRRFTLVGYIKELIKRSPLGPYMLAAKLYIKNQWVHR